MPPLPQRHRLRQFSGTPIGPKSLALFRVHAHKLVRTGPRTAKRATTPRRASPETLRARSQQIDNTPARPLQAARPRFHPSAGAKRKAKAARDTGGASEELRRGLPRHPAAACRCTIGSRTPPPSPAATSTPTAHAPARPAAAAHRVLIPPLAAHHRLPFSLFQQKAEARHEAPYRHVGCGSGCVTHRRASVTKDSSRLRLADPFNTLDCASAPSGRANCVNNFSRPRHSKCAPPVERRPRCVLFLPAGATRGRETSPAIFACRIACADRFKLNRSTGIPHWAP